MEKQHLVPSNKFLKKEENREENFNIQMLFY